MKKLPYIILTTFVLVACGETSKPSDAVVSDKDTTDSNATTEDLQVVEINLKSLSIPVPKNYAILDSVCGDLTNDGIDELVVIYDLTKETDDMEGTPRSIVIYQVEKESWKPMVESKEAVMGSKDGGMMGDPYQNVEIKKGILSIYHYGGSAWKWGEADKYRYQNDEFVLIGNTSDFGNYWAEWTKYDFNLSTGKLNYEKEYFTEDGNSTGKFDKETVTKKGIHVTLENRFDNDVKIELPKTGQTFYL